VNGTGILLATYINDNNLVVEDRGFSQEGSPGIACSIASVADAILHFYKM